jgi:hypothetical protein
MRRIYKYELHSGSKETDIYLPKDAEFLDVQMQGSKACVWFIFDKVNEYSTLPYRTFRVYGTGEPIEDERAKYLKTFHSPPFVWHFFEVIR